MEGEMDLFETIVILVSGILLLLLVIWRDRPWPNWWSLGINLGVLVLYGLFLHYLFGFPALGTGYPKGPENGNFLLLASAMYICMVAGMGAEYLYHHLDTDEAHRRKFEVGTFLKPFLVSPLVFMPLVTSLQNANIDLSRFDAARLMVFLVAFENGLLWRGYFARNSGRSRIAETQARSR
jgi:hypothetical protein